MEKYELYRQLSSLFAELANKEEGQFYMIKDQEQKVNELEGRICVNESKAMKNDDMFRQIRYLLEGHGY